MIPRSARRSDVSEAQAEAMIRRDSIADDLGTESIAGLTRLIAFHTTSFSGFVPS